MKWPQYSLRALLLITAASAACFWQLTRPRWELIWFLPACTLGGVIGGWLCYRLVERLFPDDA